MSEEREETNSENSPFGNNHNNWLKQESSKDVKLVGEGFKDNRVLLLGDNSP